ncbi:MAG: N-6 DNA methylase [Mesorhizobium sp.]|uniref:HsdM family class I SAM-dependent methyltransferase n=1 Tax=Mesorhizobium sp. TaxID=1871066 RepID=UPI000FE7C981|nr:N-6 DNA methylase [Mesorhizobium sp.]RWA75341.1 MAG: N-6 DNA methylase [Mesorhizobium sp.]
MTSGFAPRWREALSLDRRRAPEFYAALAEVQPGPHAEAIRFALGELRLSGVFCIEGVPTIGFLSRSDVSLEQIDQVHRILWNQGLMSLLLVIRDDELTAYSLLQRPFQREPDQKADPRLITTLSLLTDALKLRELIDSAESGRFWFENDAFFDPDNRVDSVLLSNLLEAFRNMRGDLGEEAAQALLMQTMFVAYLEDRKIIKEAVFREASGDTCSNLAEMLEMDSPAPFESLFVWLKGAFNGNLFNAPCAFEMGDVTPPRLAAGHLRTLARFRHGREEMASGQLRLWGYDFRYMSIGLISAVYDRFLKEEAQKKSADGAFYTPMFLADVVVNQLWDDLSDEQRDAGIFCDPACGSGIFLVRFFQRLVAHHCRTKNKRYATWNELKIIARRLHGGDINSSAVRVAAFSLYIALLEQSNPPDLPALIKAGKLLPPLYGDTLRPASDFFASDDARKYDALIGNPPWKGRRGQLTTAQTWANARGYPDPAKDIAWGFVWKALEVVKPTGLIAFLLPAMGILHNTSRESQDARRLLLRKSKVRRIINLSDLCFQLFDGAQRPTAFVLYGPATGNQPTYRFDYWVPKADLNLRLKRLMTLSRADRIRFRSDLVDNDPTLFKRRLWTRAPEERLIQYLRTLPTLGAFIRQYKEIQRAKIEINRATDWVIGQGFKPAQESRLGEEHYETTTSDVVTRYPYLDAEAFKPIAIPKVTGLAWHTSIVHRKGFPDGFAEPHILIPQGVERSIGRTRAAYSEQSVVFEHSLQAIAVPETERRKAKVLTAVLNSSLAAWIYFHDTANFGADRAKVHQGELLKLPFDVPRGMPDPARAAAAEEKIIDLVDWESANVDLLFSQQTNPLHEIDRLVFDYYGLDDREIALVEDTFHYIIPAMQPRRSAGLQKIWTNSRYEHRSAYASMLCGALEPTFRQPVSACLAALSSDVAVLRLTISPKSQDYSERSPSELAGFLRSIHDSLPAPLPGNVQLVPDLRFVIDSEMYLVKPIQLRHWLRSTALADAEQIAAEFSAVVARRSQAGGVHVGR